MMVMMTMMMITLLSICNWSFFHSHNWIWPFLCHFKLHSYLCTVRIEVVAFAIARAQFAKPIGYDCAHMVMYNGNQVIVILSSFFSASEMTYIVSSGALNSTHSLTHSLSSFVVNKLHVSSITFV